MIKKIDIYEEYNNHPKSELLYGIINDNSPKFTIIIPTYKREARIERCLLSAVNQTYSDYEIVIVDNDNNFDNTILLNIIKQLNNPKIRYYKNKENLGAEGNFNRGLYFAQGEHIMWLHDDDFLELNFLEYVSKKLCGNKAIYTGYKNVFENANTIKSNSNKNSIKQKIKNIIKKCLSLLYYLNPFKNKATIRDLFTDRIPVGVIGTIYNRDAIIESGGFNKEYSPGTDYEINIRYVSKYGAMYYNKQLVNYVIAENGTLTICQVFAAFNYKLRTEMIELGYVKNSQKNRELINYLYFRECVWAKKNFGVESEKIESVPHIKKNRMKMINTRELLIAKVKFN